MRTIRSVVLTLLILFAGMQLAYAATPRAFVCEAWVHHTDAALGYDECVLWTYQDRPLDFTAKSDGSGTP